MDNFKIVISLVVGIFLGLVACYFWLGDGEYGFSSGNEKNTPSKLDAEILNEKRNEASVIVTPETEASLVVETQLAGNTAVIKDLVMPQDGWVVVHEVLDGFVANALGATRVDAGDYDIVTVELLRPSTPENTYVVTLYSDNGNKQFEINTDTPMINNDGDAVFKEFETASGSAS